MSHDMNRQIGHIALQFRGRFTKILGQQAVSDSDKRLFDTRYICRKYISIM